MTDTARPAAPNATDAEAILISEGAPAQEVITGRQLWFVLGALMLTMLLAALDQTIVSTALPRITSDLNGLGQLSWVVTAYLLTSTASTPIWGKISDLYGRKIMLQAAIVIFLVGSALAGAAQTMEWLIVTRGIQGLGGGGLMVLAIAVIADVIPPRERGRYTGLFGGVFAVSSIAGPLLGGFFVDSLSWRWIFYINLPLGMLAMFVIAAALRVPRRRVEHSIDYLGAGLMVAGVTLLLLVVEWGGNRYPWNSTTILAMSALAIGLLVAFVWVELRAKEPLVPMSLFANRIFSTSSVLGFILGLAMFGAIIFVPLYLQMVTGATPTEAGLQMVPMMIGLLGASIISGRLITRFGRYKIFPIIGMGTATVAMFAMSQLRVDTPYWQLAIVLTVLGIGMGNVLQVLIIAVQNSVHPGDVGVATSGSTFFRSMGGTIGTALFGAVMTSQLMSRLADALPVGATGSMDLGGVTNDMARIAALPEPIRLVVLQSFTGALDRVFLTAVPILAFGFVLSWFLKDIRLHEVKPDEHARLTEPSIA